MEREYYQRYLGLGAGIDSFYEILLKSFIMYGKKEDMEMFEEAYTSIKHYMRRCTYRVILDMRM